MKKLVGEQRTYGFLLPTTEWAKEREKDRKGGRKLGHV